MPIDGHCIRPALSIEPEVPGDGVQAVGMAAEVPPVADDLGRLGGQLVAAAPAVFLVVRVVVLVTVGRIQKTAQA